VDNCIHCSSVPKAFPFRERDGQKALNETLHILNKIDQTAIIAALFLSIVSQVIVEETGTGQVRSFSM